MRTDITLVVTGKWYHPLKRADTTIKRADLINLKRLIPSYSLVRTDITIED